MRLFHGQVPVIAEEIIRTLLRNEELEVVDENVDEAQLDVESVLREFIRMDRELTDRAREMVARSGGQTSIGRVKRQLAKEKHFKVGDEAIDYVIDQLIETFLYSHFVEEVFAEDHEIRKRLAPIIRKYTQMEEELDKEVRDKIKNIEEGSQTWDIEYQKVMDNLKRKKNLE